MTDEVDITAKELPKVEEKSRHPAGASLEVTDTGGPPQVAETVSSLEPVAPANTLDLEDEGEGEVNTAEIQIPRATKAIDLVPDEKREREVATKLRRAVPRALGGDGFEGASVRQVQPINSRSAELVALARQSGWLLVVLGIAAVLMTFALIFWLAAA